MLLPVLDNAKHYWVADDEVDKLIRHGEGWLADHPLRDAIARRYLAHSRSLANQAIERLVEAGRRRPGRARRSRSQATRRPPRRGCGSRTCGATPSWPNLSRLAPRTVADVGCGDGALLAPLLKDGRFTKVVGTDVSSVALARAARRLHVDKMTERQASRLDLFQSSATYRDRRLEGFDAIVLMEVIEHLDLDRLPALVSTVFAHAQAHATCWRPPRTASTTPASSRCRTTGCATRTTAGR